MNKGLEKVKALDFSPHPPFTTGSLEQILVLYAILSAGGYKACPHDMNSTLSLPVIYFNFRKMGSNAG